MVKLRCALLCFLVLIAGVVTPAPFERGEARAAVALAFSLDELVGQSSYAVIAQGVERRSIWEELGGSKRIVTYTRLRVIEVAFGKIGKDAIDVWVRTLGGVVGKIGQHVSGEARLSTKSSALLFLTRGPGGVVVVTGAAQGHFPIIKADKPKATPRLRLSPDLGKVLPRRSDKRPAAVAQLQSRTPADALTLIRQTKARLDARKR